MVDDFGHELPGWQLDELISAGRENLDPDHVEHYDAKEDASAAAEVALCAGLGLGPDTVVVELGAGTGQFALEAAKAFGRVVAVDISPVMLGRLKAKAGAQAVEVVQAGFLTYEHEGATPDLIYSRYALHHLPDAWKAIALHRMRSMLEPGGLVRLWDIVYHFEPGDAPEYFEAWCASIDGQASDEWQRGDLEEHIRDEHSTFSWLLGAMIDRAGFDIEQAEFSDDGMFAKYVLRAVTPGRPDGVAPMVEH